MSYHGMQQINAGSNIFIVAAAVTAAALYCILAFWTSRSYKKWPLQRYFLWIAGIAAAAGAIAGPLGEAAQSSFHAHMASHLLLGMLAPLLLLYAKPATLALRSLPKKGARKLSRLLHSKFVLGISHPVVAALLNTGGLAVVYRTDVFVWMHQYTLVYWIVHLHMFLAGYLFVSVILYADISPQRHSYMIRTAVLIAAFAGHKILAKSLYAMPPPGVATADAQSGALFMYYGGDLIDLAMIILLCWNWYKASAPGRRVRPV